MKKRIFVLLIYFLFISLSPFFYKNCKLFSQNNLKFDHLGVENGLSQNSVRAIIQDIDGYLLLGTGAGLNSYDGRRFKLWGTNENDVITTLYVDKGGTLWIGCVRGLIRVDRDNASTKRYIFDAADTNSFSSDNISSIVEDSFGNLWIGTTGGLNRFDRTSEKFLRITQNSDGKKSLSGSRISSLYIAKDEILWIGTLDGGLNFVDLKKGNNSLLTKGKFDRNDLSFIQFKNDPKSKKAVSNIRVTSICQDNQGDLWIGTDNEGIIRVSNKSIKNFLEKGVIPLNIEYKEYKNRLNDINSLSHNNVTIIYKGQSDNVWVGTYGGGLNRYNKESDNFSRFETNRFDPQSLNSNYILSIYEDRSRNLWVGTLSGGVNKYNVVKSLFKLYKSNLIIYRKGINNDLVTSICEDSKGELWVGTRDGLNRLNSKRELANFYSHNSDIPNSLSSSLVRSICEDKNDGLWIGTADGGLNFFDRKNEKFRHYKNDPNDTNSLSNNSIRPLLLDRQGFLWIGTSGGANRLDVKTGEFKRFYFDFDQSSDSYYVWSLFEDKQGNIWFGTAKGLVRYDIKRSKIERYVMVEQNGDEKAENLILSICEDDDGIIWVGTYSGICKLVPIYNSWLISYQQNSFDNKKMIIVPQVFSDANLDKEAIYGILKDKNGNLWISTNHGLWKMNPKTNQIKKYDLNDGLQGEEFNSGAYYKSKNGEMFFGGNGGFNAFFPEEFPNNDIIPKIVITSFTKYDQIIDFHTRNENLKQIELSYKDNFFSFEFVSLDFSNPLKNNYAYMLEGFDDHWIYSGRRRYANYTNLGGGEYVFRVKGSNNDNIWNEEGISVKIIITPPIWNTWWFRILGGLLVAICIYSIFRIRVKRLSSQKKKLEIQVVERTKVIKENEDRYRNFVSQSTEAIFRLELEKPLLISLTVEEQINHFYKYCYVAESNNAAAKMFSFDSADDLVEARFGEIYDILNEIHIGYLKTFFSSGYKLAGGKMEKTDKEGNVRFYLINLIGIVEDKFLIRAWGLGRDVTEKQKMEEELSKSQKLESVGVLAGGIAHDFNNLLTAILGNISLAKMDKQISEKSNKRLIEAEKAISRAKDLTQQLLTFSKGGAPIKKLTSIPDLLKDTINFILSGSKNKCEFSISENLWSVNCDEGQISQVISNLIINAEQAMPSGGVIQVIASNLLVEEFSQISFLLPGKYVMINVRDQGVGIPQEQVQKIFDPYYTTKQKGRGLGLATVYSIIKKHDGYIDVESKVGVGTTFHIYLPANEEQSRNNIMEKTISDSGSGKILIMDDEEMIREIAKEMLSSLGYQIEIAIDGNDAIRKYEESVKNKDPFDVVILDLTIPGGMGGKDTIQKLKEINPNIKALVSSGYSNDPVMSDFKQYGFSGVIAKPYKIEEINQILNHTIISL